MSTTVPPQGTYYQVLGVSSTASVEEIRAAYRRLARTLHPDAHGGAAGSDMASVNEAWRVLSDPGRRATYDASLRVGRRSPGTASRDTGAEDGADAAGGADLAADSWDELDPAEAEVARRLAVVLAVTVVVVLILLGALFLYAFTRSGTLPPPRHSRVAISILVS